MAARATADGRSLEQQVAYLETELRHAQMETRVKDEYITYLTQPQPAMDRALRLVLREERLRTRARESLRRLPPLRYLWRRLHSPTARDQ
ncbi:MAG: hypothetical protein JOY80_12865 [Candidatus Dormibacteraeota bacterium]|nr:hypothetical protein [Candidatus Dormibacteraeota bacterium]